MALLAGFGVSLFIISALRLELYHQLTLMLLLGLFVYGLYLYVVSFFAREIHEPLVETQSENIKLLVTAMIATFVTYMLNVQLGFGAVVASGLVGLISSCLLPAPLSVMAYTGAFVGMSSATRFPNVWYTIVAGCVVGLVYILTRRVYQGFGGRLGTVAAVSVILASALLRLI